MTRGTASSKRSPSQSRSRSAERSGRRRSASQSKSSSRSRSAAADGKKASSKDNDGDGMELDGEDDVQDKRRSSSTTKDKSALADASLSPSKVFSLRVDNLTRNVNADHLSEIFGKFGAVVSVNLVRERVSKVPKGFAFVVFKTHSDAEKAQDHMHDGWLDGKKVRVRFASDDDQRRSRSVERSNNNGSSSNNNNSASGRRGRENVPRNKRSLSPRGRRGSLVSPPRNNNRQSVAPPSARVVGEELVVQRRLSVVAAAVRSTAAATTGGLDRAPVLVHQLSVDEEEEVHLLSAEQEAVVAVAVGLSAHHRSAVAVVVRPASAVGADAPVAVAV
ncbi:RNA recognition motif domain containing protein [Globisporangium polare]